MTKAERRQLQRESAIEQAKLMLGFGDVQGFPSKPCDTCGSYVTRTYDGKTECIDHYLGPLVLELPLT